MDNLRELDYRLARLLGWELIDCQWYDPEGNRRDPPYWHRSPAACAELDGEMEKQGYTLDLVRTTVGKTYAKYFIDNKDAFQVNYEKGNTEWEARTRAAISALENAKGEGNK